MATKIKAQKQTTKPVQKQKLKQTSTETRCLECGCKVSEKIFKDNDGLCNSCLEDDTSADKISDLSEFYDEDEEY